MADWAAADDASRGRAVHQASAADTAGERDTGVPGTGRVGLFGFIIMRGGVMVRRIVPTVVVLVLLAAGLVLAPRSSVSAVARRSSPAASPATCVTTTPDQNAALVRRFIEEIWGQGNATTVDEVVAPDFVVHIPDLARYFPTAHAPRAGRAGLKASIKELHTDDPDLQITIDDLIVDGNTVAARMTWAGTQADDFEIWGGAENRPPHGAELDGLLADRLRPDQRAGGAAR